MLMGRSQETSKKKEVRSNKQKKKKEKEKKRLARKENKKSNSLDDMIAYVNEDGSISSTPPDQEDKEETNIDDIEISIPKKEKEAEPDPIRKGIVTFYNESKGYGFIRDLESKESVFMHAKNLTEEVTEGNVVHFEVEQGPKGLVALNVKLSKANG
jgi:cold shock CspA family protein